VQLVPEKVCIGEHPLQPSFTVHKIDKYDSTD